MNRDQTDTICALATAPGQGAVAMVRVSGDQCFEIVDRCLIHRRRCSLHKGFSLHRATVTDRTGEEVDDVVVAVYHAPNSYTGEDSIELSCHGGQLCTDGVVRALLDAGARPAEPGEFTLRAFLNGKLDLAQAEAVADLISAKTADAYRIARLQQQGVLSHKVTSLRDRLLGHLAAIEAVIDFPEDVSEPDYALISTDCDLIDGELRSLAATAEFGRIYRDGVRIVLAGEPNVGKSSLMNALLRHNRAIVTAVPGTTRDVIEEEMNLRGFPVVLIDTAGLRYTQDEVEKIGVQRTHDALDAADLTLAVLDASQPKSSLAALSANADLGPNAIVVWNKSDIAEECCDRASGVCVSAVTGDGLDDLEAMIASRLRNRSGERTDGIVVSRVRHQQVLLRAARCCHEAVQTIAQAMPPDFVSIDLHGALTALGEITGETTHDDIIAEIFSRFCIGK